MDPLRTNPSAKAFLRRCFLWLAFFAVLAGSPKLKAAGVYTVLQTIEAPDLKISSPLTLGDDGNFYGYSVGGSILQITPAGDTRVLHTFAGVSQPVAPYPAIANNSPLVKGKDGALYGVTNTGGTTGSNTVFFRVTLAGEFSTLHQFSFAAGEFLENGLLLSKEGFFYGTTYRGGANDNGTVFRLTPAGEFSVIHDFPAPVPSSGQHGHPYPYYDHRSLLAEGPDGALYGSFHNDAFLDYGTYYKVSSGGKFTALHTFTYLDPAGLYPGQLCSGPDGSLYGTIGHFNEAPSTLFRLNPDGSLSTLAAFDQPNLQIPYSLFTGENGQIYGLASDEGRTGLTLFRYAPGTELSPLYRFPDTKGTRTPANVLQGKDGSFYGVSIGARSTGYAEQFFHLVVVPSPVVTVTVSEPVANLGTKQKGEFLLSLPSATEVDLPVTYVLKGDAVSGRDFKSLKGKTKIKAGQSSQTIRIVPLGDFDGATKRSVKLILTPSDRYDVATPAPAKVKIVADKP